MIEDIPDPPSGPHGLINTVKLAGAIVFAIPTLLMAVIFGIGSLLAVFWSVVLVLVKGYFLRALLLLTAAAAGLLFAYSLCAMLMCERHRWYVTLGLALGFAVLSLIMLDISIILTTGRWGGFMQEFRLGPGSATLIYAGWITTGVLLGGKLFSFFAGSNGSSLSRRNPSEGR